ncbi:MAG: cyanophycin synthetase [Legionella sp.]|nr:cyanophycin synthetase [Legionella sp.]
MKILGVQVLKGPNYWSKDRVIVLNLDLGPYEYLPTNELPSFNESLKQLMPSLYTHRCSIGTEGGFYKRLEQGTWLGHVLEHIALELQTLAGMNCGFGRTIGTAKTGIYDVVYEFVSEKAGLYAGKLALDIVTCLAEGGHYSQLADQLGILRNIYIANKLGPSTQALVDEAIKRNIPVAYAENSSFVRFGQGCHQQRMWATVSSHTSSIAVDIASNKDMTKNLLKSHFIPIPKGVLIETLEEMDKALLEIDFPLVVKPLNGNHGRGILTHIYTREKALIGFALAKQISEKIIVEQQIPGDDYRFLVINYKLVAVAKRTPARIIGTGFHSVQQLVDIANEDPNRGPYHENILTKIEIDEVSLSIMKEKNLHVDSILPKDEVVYLKGIANLSAGGTAMDVTDMVHPINIKLAERIARIINLDICGIDIIAQSISSPIGSNNGAVIEVNAGPGFRMHLYPTQGKPRNVAAAVLDMFYPEGQPAHIPVVAVTGTNGKTTVVRLIAHLAKIVKHCVGFTTTEGIYINDELIHAGDCSGPLSAGAVLSNPMVDYAVLECARGGIIRSGLGFDQCDISIITNISEDHLGLEEIETLEQLTRVKAVVAFSTKKTGYAILNAEDPRLVLLSKELQCNIALFGLCDNAIIKAHCKSGGMACYIENDFIVVKHGKNKKQLAQIPDIPLTFKGSASCMIMNLLPAALAGVISGFSLEKIAAAMREFLPVPNTLPGRMNIFNFDKYNLMIDYAHNEGAYIELKNYFSQLKDKRKIGIIGAVGDRKDSDIQKIGFYSAQIFDEIIIKHDKDSRGSTNERLTTLLKEGIMHSQLQPKIDVITDEFEAVQHAINNSCDKTFIFYSPENVFKAIEFIENVQKNSTIARPT